FLYRFRNSFDGFGHFGGDFLYRFRNSLDGFGHFGGDFLYRFRNSFVHNFGWGFRGFGRFTLQVLIHFGIVTGRNF
ncbi:MAG TPA: hypothetical protein P5086_07580, partial [Prolixibacteraceae bacterium]|nr:hypothetical protein [Prolixibacteraceae bacterium]